MLNSVLLHLPGARAEGPVIELGVALSSRLRIRLRGLSVLDTRSLLSLNAQTEIPVFTGVEQLHLQCGKLQQEQLRQRLLHACTKAGISVDVRLAKGDPLDLLPSESQFHDLTLSCFPPPQERRLVPGHTELTCSDFVAFLDRGVQPLLLVREKEKELRRILMVYDGTAASGKAVKQFLNQRLFPSAEFRLLAAGPTLHKAKEYLKEMAAYCRLLQMDCEAGFVVGRAEAVILPYSARWEADLIVLGVRRQPWRIPWLVGNPVSQILQKSACAIYAAS
ncbi:universal stress protein [Lignipirellula cremea]|uniref:Universal stress protein family protein n=1 Tax=Lignipirellula cremea TaxID=2528010 RepID=A0A518DX41_9BACT|nr:universal stress protein [Lignipirellula cremea]QDU96418.1 Universal stress protein family protein [Lignipirellula cremea]